VTGGRVVYYTAGDVYRYTLTPAFTSLTAAAASFRCRLTRRPRDVIGHVTDDDVIGHVRAYVTLPGPAALDSPVLHHQLRAGRRDLVRRPRPRDLDLGRGDLVGRRRGGRHSLFAGMLTVDDDVGGPSIDSDVILAATHDDDDDAWSYTIQSAATRLSTRDTQQAPLFTGA